MTELNNSVQEIVTQAREASEAAKRAKFETDRARVAATEATNAREQVLAVGKELSEERVRTINQQVTELESLFKNQPSLATAAHAKKVIDQLKWAPLELRTSWDPHVEATGLHRRVGDSMELRIEVTPLLRARDLKTQVQHSQLRITIPASVTEGGMSTTSPAQATSGTNIKIAGTVALQVDGKSFLGVCAIARNASGDLELFPLFAQTDSKHTTGKGTAAVLLTDVPAKGFDGGPWPEFEAKAARFTFKIEIPVL
jgi:hypothetical protein